MGGDKVTFGLKQHGTLFRVDPDEVRIVTDETSPLYAASAHQKPNEATVALMMEIGCDDPIAITRDESSPDQPTVVDGRHRVINAREANRRLRVDGKDPIWLLAYITRNSKGGSLLSVEQYEEELRRKVIAYDCHKFEKNPVERSKRMRRMLQSLIDGGVENPAALSQVAMLFNCGEQTVRDSVKLIDQLSESQLVAVERGEVSYRDAVAASRLDTAKEREAAIKAAQKETGRNKAGAPRREVRSIWKSPPKRAAIKYIKDALVEKRANTKRPVPDETIAILEWLAGEVPADDAANRVKGLDGVLNDYEQHQKKQAKQKAKKAAKKAAASVSANQPVEATTDDESAADEDGDE